uniref:LOW QUALITY PROTEIN: centromere protein F-like n=1 Tax=Fragaria vesca subsp. vesca TaxID=101020 RepID=UPI0005C976BE|nr:PREDICTED: LOW QUALITY PROTEIN: centromere protein F-like [Fragaria vesca subsp. vesca]
MFRTWSKKKKIKAVFQLQFQATEVPKLKKPGLMISLVPDDVGKPTVKLPKTKAQDGTCTWENPVYESVKLVEESKSGKLKEKIYHFIVSTGTSKSGYLGEASIDFADFVAETEPLTVTLPLKFANSGVVLHVTILRVQEDGDYREIDDSEDPSLSRHSSVDIQNSNWDTDGSNHLSYTENGAFDRTSNGASSVSPQVKDSMPQNGKAGTTATKLALDWSSDESSFDSPTRVEDKPPTEKVKDVSGDSIEKLRKENAMLMRQADTSELELQSLRKQVAKESSQGQNLSRQIISLEEERDALKLECQQLKSLRGRGEEVHASQKLQPADKDTRVQLEAMKQELNREKKVKANLHSQLQTTQDSNSELVLVVKDLEELLVKKNKEIADLSNKLETEKNSKLMGKISIHKTDVDAQEVESLKQKLRELLSEMDTYEKEREEQDMHIKRLTLDYDLLKKKNNDISLKLDRNQEKLRTEMENERAGYIATIKELESQVNRSEETIEKQAHEFAECLISIQELENEVKCLEMELEKQAKGFEDKLEDLAHAKDEQEQRANKAEEALRKTRGDSAATAERLQNELRKLSMEMTSKVDENEKQTTKALAEANDLRVQNRILEEMLQKSNEQLELIKGQIDAKAKHVEQISSELENKTKQLEYALLHKEEKHEALTMKIQMLKAEIERLTEENSNITKQEEEKLRGDLEQMKKLISENQVLIQNLNVEKHDLEKRLASSKQESVKTHEELTNIKSLKDEKETAITHLKSEVDNLRTQYNESKSTLRKEALEKENLSKQILQLQAGLKKEGRTSTAEKKLKKYNGQAAISSNNQRKSEDSAERERNYKDLLTELTLLKERNASMEKELKEMEERYSEVSLRFAEVEGERQQLVMTVRNLRSNKKN